MERCERLNAENIALKIALRTLLSQLDHASEANARRVLQVARDTAEAMLLATPLPDEQAEHVRAVLALLETDLGQALPLASL